MIKNYFKTFVTCKFTFDFQIFYYFFNYVADNNNKTIENCPRLQMIYELKYRVYCYNCVFFKM